MIHRICLILAATSIAMSTVSFAGEPSPFLGNWAGEWDDRKGSGQLNELNILAVNAKGRITALYCFERANGSGSFFQIKPDGIRTTIRGKVLKFNHPWGKFKYTLTDKDTLRLHLRPKKGQGGKNDLVTTRTRTLCCLDQAPNAQVKTA